MYEERSLGIYTSEPEKSEEKDSTGNESTDELLPTFGPLLSPPTFGHALGPERTAISTSAVSQAKSGISTKSVKKLAAVGRRGTSFVGKQIQNRMNNFQGVGVTTKPRLKRSAEINFDNPSGASASTSTPEGHVSLVSQHLRGQLSHDIWAIALALFLITLIETSHSIADPRSYSVFNFMFEIVSGYTNIGLSTGLPDHSFSFSGGWYTGSKLVMVVMMIRGRHRGLPVALDHAVKLPGWDNVKKQNEDAEIRRSLGKSPASMEI